MGHGGRGKGFDLDSELMLGRCSHSSSRNPEPGQTMCLSLASVGMGMIASNQMSQT